MKLNKFETALRARFATPKDALRALGIDENILNEDRSKPVARRIARDQEMTTVEEILEMIEGLSEEERLELMNLLQGSVEGEDARGRRARGARDDPPPFPGRPQTGGGMDPLDNESGRRDAQDRRRGAMDAARPGASEDFARRFPAAARIGFV